MGIFQFKIWRKNFAVDIESGNFFQIDKIASEVISLLHRYSERETMQMVKSKYGHFRVSSVVKKISSLKKNKLLFSPVQTKEERLSRKITDITLNIVNSCNLRCRYCWNQAGAYNHTFSDKRLMSGEVAIKAVDLLIKESHGAKDLVIDFYGGEPLLNYNVIKMTIEYCALIRKRRKIRFRFLLATNGTLLTKEKAEFLIENGVDIAVSLDGAKKIQDAQRPFFDGRSSFDAIACNLNSLKREYRRRLVGRATFTPYSTNLIRTFKFLRTFGFDRIEICESEKAGYGLESNSRFFFTGPEGIRHLKKIYNKLAVFYTQEIINGNLTYDNTYFNRFFKQLSRLYHIQSIVGACSAGLSLIAVDLDGSVYPCTAFVGIQIFKIGSAEKGVDETKLKNFLNTKISSSGLCNKCWAKMICRGCGSCYNLNYFSNKKLNQPDPYYCDLFRYKTKLMIAMIQEISQKNPILLDTILIPEYYSSRGQR